MLAATIAEMDFPLAPPVAAALRAAIDRHDLGYAYGVTPPLRDAFAGFAAPPATAGRVDPEQVTLVPDVMAGLARAAAACSPARATPSPSPTPAYPPFFVDRRRRRPAGCASSRCAPTARSTSTRSTRALAAGARVLVLANPHNPTGRVLPRDELERSPSCCAAHDAWVLADEIHAPLVPAGRDAHAVARGLATRRASAASRCTSASKAFNLAGLKAALAVTASDRARDGRRAPAADLGDHAGLLGVIASEAAFADGDAWLDAVLARLDANRALLGELPRRRAAGGRAGRRPRRPTSPGWTAARSASATTRPPPSWRAAGSRSVPGRLRRRGRGLRAAQLRHVPGARRGSRGAHGRGLSCRAGAACVASLVLAFGRARVRR